MIQSAKETLKQQNQCNDFKLIMAKECAIILLRFCLFGIFFDCLIFIVIIIIFVFKFYLVYFIHLDASITNQSNNEICGAKLFSIAKK